MGKFINYHSDNKLEFYSKIYEDVYSSNKNYGAIRSNRLKDSHYPGMFKYCINPSKIKFDSVLDIGCGPGVGLNYMAKDLGKKVCGIDPSTSAILKAKEKGYKCSVASATKIPYEDNSFDLVMSTDVIEHLRPEDQEEAHRECFRVSKKYIAHKIANTPEGNKFGKQQLHLTCWEHDKWLNFFHNLNLKWNLIYYITPHIFDNILGKKKNDYKLWKYHSTCVVFEKV